MVGCDGGEERGAGREEDRGRWTGKGRRRARREGGGDTNSRVDSLHSSIAPSSQSITVSLARTAQIPDKYFFHPLSPGSPRSILQLGTSSSDDFSLLLARHVEEEVGDGDDSPVLASFLDLRADLRRKDTREDLQMHHLSEDVLGTSGDGWGRTASKRTQSWNPRGLMRVRGATPDYETVR